MLCAHSNICFEYSFLIPCLYIEVLPKVIEIVHKTYNTAYILDYFITILQLLVVVKIIVIMTDNYLFFKLQYSGYVWMHYPEHNIALSKSSFLIQSNQELNPGLAHQPIQYDPQPQCSSSTLSSSSYSICIVPSRLSVSGLHQPKLEDIFRSPPLSSLIVIYAIPLGMICGANGCKSWAKTCTHLHVQVLDVSSLLMMTRPTPGRSFL